MPGNTMIINGGGISYVYVSTTHYSDQSATLTNVKPNVFYEFEPTQLVKLTEADRDTSKYQEYMFDFSVYSDTCGFSYYSTKPVYWPRPLEIHDGGRYQVSILNGVALWVEVTQG